MRLSQFTKPFCFFFSDFRDLASSSGEFKVFIIITLISLLLCFLNLGPVDLSKFNLPFKHRGEGGAFFFIATVFTSPSPSWPPECCSLGSRS